MAGLQPFELEGRPIMRPTDLTNESRYSTLMTTTENCKANCAECSRTPHSSDPTLSEPVNGLRRIIANREASVLRGFSGPSDNHCVRVGRFVVPVVGRA